jgi:hypothetical protein
VTICSYCGCNTAFSIDTQKEFTVGNKVTKLSDLYRFTTDMPRRGFVYKVRIILILDASLSMCREVTRCPGASRNDPEDKRIDAVHHFVDTIANTYPDCAIGVIVCSNTEPNSNGFCTIVGSLAAEAVDDTVNIRKIHRTINTAGCGVIDGGAFGKVAPKEHLGKRTSTFSGIALDSAIQLADAGYDSTINGERHIVIVTDGDRNSPATSELFASYSSLHPGRRLPFIHCVFISDSATHVGNGFPAQGMISCDSSTMVPVDPFYLQFASEATHGNYFPLTTPLKIEPAFDSLFRDIIFHSNIITTAGMPGFPSIAYTNLSTGEQIGATFQPDSSIKGRGHYLIAIPAFNLMVGKNSFGITWTASGINQTLLSVTDTITVNRLAQGDTAKTDFDFTPQCLPESVDVSINCSPGILKPNEFDTVKAAVDPGDLSFFLPNDIALRAFTPFPDEDDSRVFFLFHLDGGNLVNSSKRPQVENGTGTPAFSRNGVFGSCIGEGAFSIPGNSDISGDFCFECWMRPGASARNASIAGATGFSFVMKDGYLSATVGDKIMTTTHIVDSDVWQHVAVARVNGETNIFINGIPMASKTNTTATITGTFTIGSFANGLLDEVRFSSFARIYSVFNHMLIEIPTAANLSWNIKNTVVTGASTKLFPEMWGSMKGKTQFLFTRTAPGSVIVNFFDTLANGQLMWSKNGDPVNFSSTEVYNGKAVQTTNMLPKSAVKLFDVQGRLIRVTTKDNLAKNNNITGVCIIKHLNGKIERRIIVDK